MVYLRFPDKLMSVTEFMEYMRQKYRLRIMNRGTSPINNSVIYDVRSTSENQHINIVFFTEEKLTTNVKRRYESQVHILISFTYCYYFILN